MRSGRGPRLRSARRIAIAAIALGFGLLSAAPATVATDGGGLPPEAIAVLGRFLGEWETTTRITQEGTPGATVERKGRATCRRTVGDRYVEFRSESIPAGRSELQIMTYDVDSGRYWQWVFDSDGYRHVAAASWDPATATLTWTGARNGATFAIADRWVTPDRLEWSLTRTTADGRVSQTITGTLVRVTSH